MQEEWGADGFGTKWIRLENANLKKAESHIQK